MTDITCTLSVVQSWLIWYDSRSRAEVGISPTPQTRTCFHGASHMSKKDYPTVDHIRECLRYEDGKLFWLQRPLSHFPDEHAWKIWNSQFSGKEAGGVFRQREEGKHRFRIRIHGVGIFRYDIVWALHYGEWPRQWIDHKNTIPHDDKIDNLRLCTDSQNKSNQKTRKNNSSGCKGVYWHKKSNKWMARIQVDNDTKYLGCFHDIDEAHAAYVEAARRYFGEFANDGT